MQYTHPFDIAPRADGYRTKGSPDDRRNHTTESVCQHSAFLGIGLGNEFTRTRVRPTTLQARQLEYESPVSEA